MMKIAITTDTHYCKVFHSIIVKMLEEIKKNDPDILIHCGDVASTNWLEQKLFWSLAREILGKKIIMITVKGNHDWWDKYYDIDPAALGIKRPQSFEDIIEIHQKEIYDVFNIHHASENITIDRIHFSGFDGWYQDKEVPFRFTKDSKMIPRYYVDSSQWDKHNVKGFENALNFLNKQTGKKILITHHSFTECAVFDWKNEDSRIKHYFGNNLRYEIFIDNIDYLFYGHTHVEMDSISKNGHTKVINVGSDYYYPKYKIMEF